MRGEARLRQRLAAAVALGALGPALTTAELLDEPGAWREAGAAAVSALDVAMAAR